MVHPGVWGLGYPVATALWVLHPRSMGSRMARGSKYGVPRWYLGSEMGYFGGPKWVNLAIWSNKGYPPREGPETVERA